MLRNATGIMAKARTLATCSTCPSRIRIAGANRYAAPQENAVQPEPGHKRRMKANIVSGQRKRNASAASLAPE